MITTVGAWAGSRALRDPRSAVGFALEHNINRLDIIVNDHSADRRPRQFDIRRPDRIVELANRCWDAGIEPHLMSWIMPHRDYLEGAAVQLLPLMEKTGALSLQWDAEEPWTKAGGTFSYEVAAERVRMLFEGVPMGVNGIGYASKGKLKDIIAPLADVCDYIVPQAYSTTSSKQAPEWAAKRFHDWWKEAFDRPVIIGLAAYRQGGIPGHTVTSAMKTAIDTAASTGVQCVIYWSLAWIQKSRSVAAAVKSIRQEQVS